MIRHDFENGGFPINSRAPILCFSSEGVVYPVYNRYDLYLVLNNPKTHIIKAIGVWPGKINTDCFVLYLSAYQKIPHPPKEHANIDSAEEITLIYDHNEAFIKVSYRPIPDSALIISTDQNLLRYIIEAGLQHKVLREAEV